MVRIEGPQMRRSPRPGKPFAGHGDIEDGRIESRSSLIKGLDLLTVIAQGGGDGMTASAAARRCGMHTATAHRLLKALVERQFVSFDPYTKRYSLGFQPFDIVAKAGQSVAFVELRRRLRRAIANGGLDGLGIICVSVLVDHEALCIDLVPNGTDIAVNTLKVGSRRPLGVGAASLALLAAMPDAARDAVISREAERYQRYGRVTAETVRDACARLGAQGYVVNEALVIPDIAALAVPGFDDDGQAFAISVTNVASRLLVERRREIGGRLLDTIRQAGLRPGVQSPLRDFGEDR